MIRYSYETHVDRIDGGNAGRRLVRKMRLSETAAIRQQMPGEAARGSKMSAAMHGQQSVVVETIPYSGCIGDAARKRGFR